MLAFSDDVFAIVACTYYASKNTMSSNIHRLTALQGIMFAYLRLPLPAEPWYSRAQLCILLRYQLFHCRPRAARHAPQANCRQQRKHSRSCKLWAATPPAREEPLHSRSWVSETVSRRNLKSSFSSSALKRLPAPAFLPLHVPCPSIMSAICPFISCL